MFCSICQKPFQNEKNYKAHTESTCHKKMQEHFNADPLAYKTKLTKQFVNHFVSFISNKNEYTELNVAYQQYLAGNKYRIKGTLYKNLTEVALAIRNRVSTCMLNGEYHVKRLDDKVIMQEIDLDDLYESP